MPIYEYEPNTPGCEQCGGRFSDLQSLREPAHTQCPTCEKPCHKVLSSFMVIGSRATAPKAAKTNATPTATSPISEKKSAGHNHNCAAAGCFSRARKLLDGK